MDVTDLNSKLVAILGFGQEGRATAQYLIKHGIKPVLFDKRPWEDWSKEKREEIKNLGVNFIFGPDYLIELKGFDIAFRSPGIRLADIKKALGPNSKTRITSQTQLFFENSPAKIIGITGTKGKGTTSSLIFETLKASGKNVFLTGNIGKIQPLEFLDQLTPTDWVVYELSSFQLQGLTKSPHIAVVLMVTSEHLDYHKDLEEYIDAKAQIAKFQTEKDYCVVNLDFPNSTKIGEFGKAKKVFFSSEKKCDCFFGDGVVYLENHLNGHFGKVTGWQLRGSHNIQNICAAALASDLAGCPIQAIDKAAFEFKGLEHRLELAAEKKGIKFYNDSFSTTPETAIAAINSFKEPLILILGGSSKNSDFTELGKVINNSKNIKQIILIGGEAPKLKKFIKDEKIIQEGAQTMGEIFFQINKVAKPGDVVLLSPACASFGMFKNYKDRGDQFKKFAQNYEG